MEANSALAGVSAKAWSNWERGDHRTGRFRHASDTASALRIRLDREYRNGFPAFVKIGGASGHTGNDFSGLRRAGNGAPGTSQLLESGANWPDLS
jgi:hypothetical protein